MQFYLFVAILLPLSSSMKALSISAIRSSLCISQKTSPVQHIDQASDITVVGIDDMELTTH